MKYILKSNNRIAADIERGQLHSGIRFTERTEG